MSDGTVVVGLSCGQTIARGFVRAVLDGLDALPDPIDQELGRRNVDVYVDRRLTGDHPKGSPECARGALKRLERGRSSAEALQLETLPPGRPRVWECPEPSCTNLYLHPPHGACPECGQDLGSWDGVVVERISPAPASSRGQACRRLQGRWSGGRMGGGEISC